MRLPLVCRTTQEKDVCAGKIYIPRALLNSTRPLRFWTCQWFSIKVQGYMCSMVLILDGNSEVGVHVCSDNFICFRHSFRTADAKFYLIFEKDLFPPRLRNCSSELPSNIGTLMCSTSRTIIYIIGCENNLLILYVIEEKMGFSTYFS